MATHNYTGVTVASGVPDVVNVPWAGSGKIYVAKRTIDLTGDALTENDVYQVIPIPANTLVQQVKCEMVTAGVGTTLTMDIGDASGADSWDANVDGKGVATTVTSSAVGTDAYAAAADNGKFYSAADTIDITMDVATAITAGPKLTLYALCVDYN